MTYKSLTEQGYELTDKEAMALRREVLSIYTDARKSITQAIKDQYAKILAGVEPDKYYNEMLKYNRLTNLLKQIETDYLKKTNRAFKLQYQAQELYFTNNYYRQLYSVDWLVSSPLTVGLVPDGLIELSVYGTDAAFKKYGRQLIETYGEAIDYTPQAGTLRQLLFDGRNVELKKIRKSITQGFVNGWSYTKQANLITDIIGKQMQQEGILTGAMANAMRIMRSEGTRNMNAAAQASGQYAAAQGNRIEKEWVATLDVRTRSAHGSADGQRVPLDKPFTVNGEEGMYPGDFPSAANNANCRCTTIQVINGKNPAVRRGRDPYTGQNEVFTYKNYDRWLDDKGLTRDQKTGKIIKKKLTI